MASPLFNQTILPSVKTSTFQKENCSELFVLSSQTGVEDDRISGDKSIVEDLGATPTATGPYRKIDSSGWSRMLVWLVVNDEANKVTSATFAKRTQVLGLSNLYNTTAHPLTTDNISDDDVEVVASNVAWFPCTVVSGSQVRPGVDETDDGSSDDGFNVPPTGTHNVGANITFNNGFSENQGHNFGFSNLFTTSSNYDTYILGPAVVDVSGTKAVTLYTKEGSALGVAGYYVGQFIS